MLTADKNVLPDPGRGAVVCHTPPMSCAVLQLCRLESSCMKESGGVVELWTELMMTRVFVKLTVLRVPENLGLKTALSQTISPDGTDWLLNPTEKHTFLAHGVDVGVVEVVLLEVVVVEVDVLEITVLEVDVLEVDVLEVDVLEVDGLDVDGLEVDGLDADVLEVDVLEVDVLEADELEVDRLEAGVLDVDVLEVVLLKVDVLKVGGLEVDMLEVVLLKVVAGVVVVDVNDRDVVEVTKQVQADEILDEELEHWKATSVGVGPNPVVAVYELQKAELVSGA